MTEDDEMREKKKRKQVRKMSKILAHAWEMTGSEPFQEMPSKQTSAVLSLSQVGQKLDEGAYRLGRHGWEDFARDIGGVYNRHVQRKTKHLAIAERHLEQVAAALADKDQSLAVLAKQHIPKENAAGKKRKAGNDQQKSSKNKRASNSGSNNHSSSNGDLTLSKREENAMKNLADFMAENGGTRDMVKNFRSRVTRKPSDGRYDTNYYNEANQRFRSMLEVGRYFGLIDDKKTVNRSTSLKKRKTSSREVEAEKKKLRKELDRLRKQHTRATKSLDEYVEVEKEAQQPLEDLLLLDESTPSQEAESKVTPANCAGAIIPDMVKFENVLTDDVPDLLMAWDFLCTFSRTLSLEPIPLLEFVQALTYHPPTDLADTDAFGTPPVYLAEAHISLLRVLAFDPSSDEWWWSVLETHDLEMGLEPVEKEESELPLIKFDFAGLIAFKEDPLLTTSWLQNLEEARSKLTAPESLRNSIMTAISVMDNRVAKGYLKKAIKLGKTSGPEMMRRAVVWLLDRVREARPELHDPGVTKSFVLKQRAKVVEDVSALMDKHSTAIYEVTDDDVASDLESDDESDDEYDSEEAKPAQASAPSSASDDTPASAIPDKPLPTLVDLLLPPGKPPLELLNACAWPYVAAAAAHRIVHRYKRLRNEVDDSLRAARELPRITVKTRREREPLATARCFSEVFADYAGEKTIDSAIQFITRGGNYLSLSTHERLCLLRILIEACYDSHRVFEVVDSNYKQRTSAIKALDAEQRRARKEAKEKAASDEAAARQDLADEIKSNFIEEKREELRKANEASKELTDEDIDALTDQEIIDVDDDIKADYDALPGPESFKKTEVMERVAKIQEAAAFGAESLTVLTLDELVQREETALEQLQKELRELGGNDALMDPSTDRDIAKDISRLQREITTAITSRELAPQQRLDTIEQLKEAMADGTVKSLRSAIRNAKTADLFGPDPSSGGVFALDIVRDAHMELENAKNLKRVADAQKDLVSKLNKCFIRTSPLGMDRFRNRFWQFEHSEKGHVWVEANYAFRETSPGLENKKGFLEIVVDSSTAQLGVRDMEDDFPPAGGGMEAEDFRRFSRQEYHGAGISPCLVRRQWGCHLTEEKLRKVTKGLDGRGTREEELKRTLKETLESSAAGQDHVHEDEKDVQSNGVAENKSDDHNGEESGDGAAFLDAVEVAKRNDAAGSLQIELVESLSSGIGQNVRIRELVGKAGDDEIAFYRNGVVRSWKVSKQKIIREDMESDIQDEEEVSIPLWRVVSEDFKDYWLNGPDLLESICRYARFSNGDVTYFESDSSFLAYRNPLGRFCGKANEAAQASTPYKFAQHMLKKESEVYSKLKQRIYDSTWGGRGANRNAWISTMRDFAFDLKSVKDGLLTLERAFYELMGGSLDEMDDTEPEALLNNPDTRVDIELETLDNKTIGLWNSKASRAIFISIMNGASTLGILSLGLELIMRNTRQFLEATKPIKSQQESQAYAQPMRVTRRMNAWQQAHEGGWD